MKKVNVGAIVERLVGSEIEYLVEYGRALEHQMVHSEMMIRFPGMLPQPQQYCIECLTRTPPLPDADHRWVGKEFQGKYSWAIPTEHALATIAEHSPNGVVEIGAGAGYWAMLLRQRGVDVVAYDIDPEGKDAWFSHDPWTQVRRGDHTSVIAHPDRTLFLCWPSYCGLWTHEVVELYTGDTVIYVGEGDGGATGTARMHALLGVGGCWHDEGDPCDCDKTEARFEKVDEVWIPQWMGLHDQLTVHKRL